MEIKWGEGLNMIDSIDNFYYRLRYEGIDYGTS